MTASKTDYEKLAEVLVSARAYLTKEGYKHVVKDIGQMYQKENERFNMKTWTEACGVTWTG